MMLPYRAFCSRGRFVHKCDQGHERIIDLPDEARWKMGYQSPGKDGEGPGATGAAGRYRPDMPLYAKLNIWSGSRCYTFLSGKSSSRPE